MAKKAGLIVFILILLGSSGWAYHYYANQPAGPIEASGTIEATTVDVSARSAGIIESLTMSEGQTVKTGQQVAVLSRSDLEAQKERDAQAVAIAQANLQDLQSGARAQELAEAESNVEIAQTNLNKAAQDLSRAEALFKAGGISQDILEQSRLNADQKTYQLKVVQERLSLLQAGSRPDKIKAAQAELERNKSVLKASQSVVKDLNLYAPIGGTVLNRNYEPGEFVQMGSSLGTIADLDHMWIKVYIPTDDLPRIKLGDKVHFSVSGDASRYSGTVTHIASKGEFTPKTIQTQKERTNVVFAVKISFANKNGALKIGMPADVVFDQE